MKNLILLMVFTLTGLHIEFSGEIKQNESKTKTAYNKEIR